MTNAGSAIGWQIICKIFGWLFRGRQVGLSFRRQLSITSLEVVMAIKAFLFPKSLMLFLFSSSFLFGCGAPNLNQEKRTESYPNSAQQRQMKKGFIFQDKKAIEIHYFEEDGYARFFGDIMLPLDKVFDSETHPTNLANYSSITKWTNGRVPYSLPANFPYGAELSAAISEWASIGISWVPRSASDVNYVSFRTDLTGTQCGLATPGMSAGAYIRLRPLNNQGGCTSLPMRFVLLHEMAHSLGFPHEFQRSDRDSHLTGLAGSTFTILPGLVNLGPFDVSSVTMYPTFLIPTMKTISGASISTPSGLSYLDRDRASAYYFGEGQCSIVGGLGTIHFSGVTSNFGCRSQCDSRAASHPDRSCAWRNATFFGAKQCSIVGGLGTTLFSSVVPKYPCLLECRKRASTHTARTCLWNGGNIKGL